FVDEQHDQTLAADLLKVWLGPGEAPRATPAGSAPGGRKPQHVDATGHVEARSKEMHVYDTSRLVVRFEDVPGDATLPPPAPPGAAARGAGGGAGAPAGGPAAGRAGADRAATGRRPGAAADAGGPPERGPSDQPAGRTRRPPAGRPRGGPPAGGEGPPHRPQR